MRIPLETHLQHLVPFSAVAPRTEIDSGQPAHVQLQSEKYEVQHLLRAGRRLLPYGLGSPTKIRQLARGPRVRKLPVPPPDSHEVRCPRCIWRTKGAR